MFKKAIHFIKYNNLVILIIAAIFLIGTGVFAQTETGQAVIGAKETTIQGVDNTLLIEADLDKLAMDFTIEEIAEDSDYYYVTYTYIDLVKANNVWQYQMREKQRKISHDLKEDLGQYLAEELSEEYEARIKDLTRAQIQARADGKEQRTEVTTYSGLVGQTLELAGKVFSNYEPVKARIMPSPSTPPTVLFVRETEAAAADDLTDIYQEYMDKNDPDRDDVFGVIDNCPEIYNPEQLDSNGDGIGDACADLLADDDISGEDNSTATSGEDIIVDDATATSGEESITEATEDEEATDESGTDEPTEEPKDEPAADEATEEEPEVEIIELPVE